MTDRQTDRDRKTHTHTHTHTHTERERERERFKQTNRALSRAFLHPKLSFAIAAVSTRNSQKGWIHHICS